MYYLFSALAGFAAGAVLSKLYFGSVQAELARILATSLGDVAKAQAAAQTELAKILSLPGKAVDAVKSEAEAVIKKL